LGGAGGGVCGWLNAVAGNKLTAIRMMVLVFIFVFSVWKFIDLKLE
jgi:hypothetical protein